MGTHRSARGEPAPASCRQAGQATRAKTTACCRCTGNWCALVRRASLQGHHLRPGASTASARTVAASPAAGPAAAAGVRPTAPAAGCCGSHTGALSGWPRSAVLATPPPPALAPPAALRLLGWGALLVDLRCHVCEGDARGCFCAPRARRSSG